MDIASISCSCSTARPPKRLLFDCRYGYIIDVWKDPSEEALSGGRGMFCIVPLAKSLIKAASEMVKGSWMLSFYNMFVRPVVDEDHEININFAASSSVQVLENPDLFSPLALQANLGSQLQRITSSMKKRKFNVAMLKMGQTFSSDPHAMKFGMNKTA